MWFLELRMAKCQQTTFRIFGIPQRPKPLAKLFFLPTLFLTLNTYFERKFEPGLLNNTKLSNPKWYGILSLNYMYISQPWKLVSWRVDHYIFSLISYCKWLRFRKQPSLSQASFNLMPKNGLLEICQSLKVIHKFLCYMYLWILLVLMPMISLDSQSSPWN